MIEATNKKGTGSMYAMYDLFRKRDYALVIAFDVGHSNTVASRVSNWEGAGLSGIDDLKISQITGNETPTIVFRDRKGQPALGGGASVQYAYFKIRPDRFDKMYDAHRTHRDILTEYLRMVMDSIIRHNPTVFANVEKEDILLLVGRPSDGEWCRYDDVYRGLLVEATGVPNVIMVPESRAAIINALFREEHSGESDFDLTQYCIVIDHGAITTDCTALSTTLPEPLEFSWPLGASWIERNMCAAVLGERELTFQDLEKSMEDVLYLFREKKEKYYTSGEDIIALKTSRGSIQAPIDAGLMRRAFHQEDIREDTHEKMRIGRSWYQHCEAFYREVAGLLDSDRLENATIVLTGGASRMDEVQEICRRTFPGARILVEDNPNLSVSHGLCHAARKDHEAADALESIHESVHRTISGRLDTLAEQFAALLKQPAYDVILQALAEWSAAPAAQSTRDSLRSLVEAKTRLKFGKQACSDAMRDTMTTWLADCASVLSDEVNQTLGQVYGNTISTDDSTFFNAGTTIFFTMQQNMSGEDPGFAKTIASIAASVDITSFMMGTLVLVSLAVLLVPFLLMDFFNLPTGWLDKLLGTDPKKQLSVKKRMKVEQAFHKEKTTMLERIGLQLSQGISKELKTRNESGDLGIEEAIVDGLKKAMRKIALYTP